MCPYPFQQEEDDSESTTTKDYAYNDYDGYFQELVDDKPLRLKKNVAIIKNIKKLIDEYFQIVSNQDVERIRKEDIIVEIAQNIEAIYRNSNLDHLVETIAATICLILTKKDRFVTPRWIYEVLQKKFKNRYVSYTGADRRNDTYSKRNVLYKDVCLSLSEATEKLKECFDVIERDKQNEIKGLIDYLNDVRLTLELKSGSGGSFTSKSEGTQIFGLDCSVPKEASSSTYSMTSDGTSTATTATGNGDAFPTEKKSLYYDRLGEYISILQKLRDNVLRFPPSPKLDKLLDESLALEIEILMPAVDMKFKRSIAQLDETVRHANIQSLGGASSVMKEQMLIRDQDGDIIDPNDPTKKFMAKFHKLAPEQIEIRKGYVSNIRKKMSRYAPHLYYTILWYEGSDILDHQLSMSKFSRTPLKKS